MATPIRITVDYSRAIRKVGRLTADVKDMMNRTLDDLGDKGKAYARARAPRYSGQTIRKIKVLKPKAMEVNIVATNILNDGHQRKIARFDLTRWMHEGGKAPYPGHEIRSGDRYFLNSTAEHLREIAPDTVKIWKDKFIRNKYR